MQKYIELLEDNCVNTYEVVFNDNNKLKYYVDFLKNNYMTHHIHSGETDASSYEKLEKYLLSHNGVDEVYDMELFNKHIIENGYTKKKFGYNYNARFVKYPLLYHVLFNDDDMLHDLYYYITNNNELGPKYDEEYEMLQYLACSYTSFYDQHINDDEKIFIIKDILDSMVFKRINSRFITNLEEYRNLEKRTSDIKELIDIVYNKNRVKKNVLGE